MLKIVILAGGRGKRLWPLSQKERPKPFVKMIRGRSLFELTVSRFQQPVSVVVPKQLVPLVHEQAPSAHVIVEPQSWGTAFAIDHSVRALMESKEDIFCFVPADHIIDDGSLFLQCIDRAVNVTNFVTLLCVKPTHFNANFGYILKGPKGLKFVEKPQKQWWDASVCAYWNTGVFIFRAGFYLEEAKKISHPLIGSFDRLFVEKTDRLNMIELLTGWRDLGTWPCLLEYLGGASEEIRKIGRILDKIATLSGQ